MPVQEVAFDSVVFAEDDGAADACGLKKWSTDSNIDCTVLEQDKEVLHTNRMG